MTKGRLLFSLGEQDYEVGPRRAVLHIPSGTQYYIIMSGAARSSREGRVRR